MLAIIQEIKINLFHEVKDKIMIVNDFRIIIFWMFGASEQQPSFNPTSESVSIN